MNLIQKTPPPNSDNVYIMAVNDRFVMKAWDDSLELDSFRNAMRQSKNKIQVRVGSTERHRNDHKHRRHHQHRDTTARLLQPELIADGAGTISASMGLLVDKGDMGGRAIRSAVVFKDGVAKYVGVDAGQPEASSAETIMGMLKKEREDAEAAKAAAEAEAKVRG